MGWSIALQCFYEGEYQGQCGPAQVAESVYKLYSLSDNQKKLYGLESQIELWVVMDWTTLKAYRRRN